MLKWVEKFESAINWLVLLMMAVVVVMLTVSFAIDLARNVSVFLVGSMANEQIFQIFGDLLLILIGLELIHTVKVYQQDHTVHVDVILSVALVAVARKVIAVNLKEYPANAIIGLAVLIIALAGGYWLTFRRGGATTG
ncbi:MAG TPA: phosphate-starvation-inducible PsiE family protein [Steroidobacteraceae bacterium]